MRPCASSTTRRSCGGWYSISSSSISAARCDMLATTLSRTSSETPRSASARSFWSTSLRSTWTLRSSSLTMSSKTNSIIRISSARSASASASLSSTLRSVPRSARLRMSTSESTPPAAEYSCEITLASFCRMTASTSLITSGLVSFIVAMRSATSA
jgi:hypothetical protein